ncbi:hypothetical protein NOR51B_40 [Luminiphilus syltensis NOR5-1B]|uniref:Photosynthetic complex assembly protein n=1 Tax=Luminiphilus syltensis NOR5-1B TaxID=565045 RepID=B8KT32_9GAMM|nr:photosynthetic complex assembly protein PuhC [Luminiphilus syltensis]EED34103.1 hypothetical protein NOR51B_40 [Luminiphilus syltensis NOR5-1B]
MLAVDVPMPNSGTDKIVLAIGALLLTSVIAVALFRTSDDTMELPPSELIEQQCRLALEDREAGVVAAVNADTGQAITVFDAGEGSFLRGVVRALVRGRNQEGLSSRAEFMLYGYTDGAAILFDPLTSKGITLQAFGETNVGLFRQILQDCSGASRQAVIGR